MIEVESTGARLVVVDGEKNEVVIGTESWRHTAIAPRLDRRVDGTVSGETRALEFPASAVTVERAGDPGWTTFDEATDSMQLREGSHVIQVETNVGVYVAFTGTARLGRRGWDGSVRLTFEAPTAVTLGFRSQVTQPRHTITVPRTLDGAASAVRYLSSAIEIDTADKSYPTLRVHPPGIAFGPRVDVPEAVYREASFSSVTVELPRSVEPLLVVSPLVYYLQADVAFVDEPHVSVDAPPLDDPVTLGTDEPLESAVARLLHRVFYLDCLVRNAGPYAADLAELPLAEELGLDIESLYGASTADRLQAYLELPYGRIRSRLPAWHLATVVEPRLGHVRALPHLLDRMSLLQPPRPVRVAPGRLVTASVRAAYAPRRRGRATPSRYDLVRNETRLGRVQGWLAPGTPVDAFRTSVAAFENRFAYHDRGASARRVRVVINDESMLEERDAVAAIYRERADELPIDVTVEASLTREELADRLGGRMDFLHYIGHCDDGGLRCDDGTLPVSAVERTGVRTFFLNACGSFEEGLELIERGSVAGVVTLHDVLNPQATAVGTTFARLVMYGYHVSLALALARRFSIVNRFYTVVGDGSHKLSQGTYSVPGIARLSEPSDPSRGYRYSTTSVSLQAHDGIFVPNVAADPEHGLFGNYLDFELGRDELLEYVRRSEMPILWRNSLYWPEELVAALE